MGLVGQISVTLGCLMVTTVWAIQVTEDAEKRVQVDTHYAEDEDNGNQDEGGYGVSEHDEGSYGGYDSGSHAGGSGYGGGNNVYEDSYKGSHGGGNYGGHGKATSYQKFVLHSGHPIKVLVDSHGGYASHGGSSHGSHGGYSGGHVGYIGYVSLGGFGGYEGHNIHGGYGSHDYVSGLNSGY